MDTDIVSVKANELSIINEPDNGMSFVMVDRATNDGWILNYNKLVDAVLSKFVTNTMSNDGLKFYVVG